MDSRKLIFVAAIGFTMALSSLSASLAQTPAATNVESAVVSKLLKQDQVDLARFKLTIDKLIDPSIDIDAGLREIDRLAAEVTKLAGPQASNALKIAAVRKVIYEPGSWNGSRPFSYDMTDPEGTKLVNKLLPTYLKTRKGNCVSMPILFLILADRVGLKVTLSTAPRHVFVRYTDDAGKVWNIETTSGANPARDEWIRENMGPYTDEAVYNGVYLKTLSRKKSLAVIANIVLQHLAERGDREALIAVSDVLLKAYPSDASLLVYKGSAYGRLIESEFISKYPQPTDIPVNLRSRYAFLAEQNDLAFTQAEGLGWRETDGGLVK
jgi:regulator of sirC expression with transglutaminase-like and TPR domain